MANAAHYCLLILLIHTVAQGNGQEVEKNVKGTVKWFNEAKGFGFINRENASKKQDIFVHYSEIHRSGLMTLAEGQKVIFDLEGGDRPKAVNLKLDS